MKKIFLILGLSMIFIISMVVMLKKNYTEPTVLMKLQEKYSKKDSASVDHTKFASLQKKIRKTSGSYRSLYSMPQQTAYGNHAFQSLELGKGRIHSGQRYC